MFEQSILKAVTTYLDVVRAQGIAVERAVVFGSQALGTAHTLSDIGLLVISPQFDAMQYRSGITLLWRLAAWVDSRIEPIPCGFRQWLEDDQPAIIEVARLQGEQI